MPFVPTFPGERGGRLTEDGEINRLESQDSRRLTIPRPDLLCWGHYGTSLAGSSATGSLSAGTVWIQYLPQIESRSIQVTHVRLGTTTAVASSYMKLGVFSIDPQTKQFHRLPGAVAIIPTDTTGQKTVEFLSTFQLFPGKLYALGYVLTDAITFYRIEGSGTKDYYYVTPPSAMELPDSGSINSWTKGEAVILWGLNAALLSKLGSEVL